jgi:hypothetical protein
VCANGSAAWCDAILGDRPRWWGIARGILNGVDRIWVFNYDNSPGSPIDVLGIVYAPGEWVHISLVHSGGLLHAFRNGVEVASTSSGTTVQPNTGALPRLQLGGIIINASRNWTFEGSLDEVSLWNVARSAAQIQQDMFRTLSGNEPGLSAYYAMSDGAGTTLTDDGPASWSGTLLDGGGLVPPNGSPPVWVVSDAFGTVGPTPTPTSTTMPPTSTSTPSPTATPQPPTPTATATASPTGPTPTLPSTSTSSPTSTLPPTSTPSLTPSGGFPTTGILDAFNRANGSLGSGWSGSTGAYAVAGNQLDVNGNGSIFWSGASYGADQEAHLTVATIDPTAGSLSLLLKSQSSSSSSAGLIRVMYMPGSQAAQVWTYSSAQGWVQRGASVPLSLVSGDRFGARARADGTVEVYRNGALVGSRNASAWTYAGSGGFIGLWMASASNVMLDDFGGGTASGGPTATPTATAVPPTPTPTATMTAETPTAPADTATPTPTSTDTPTALPSSPTSTPVPTPTQTDGGFTEISFLDTPGDAEDVTLAGSLLYVSDVTSGLRIVDVSDPEHPLEVGSLDTPGRAYGVALQGSLAYVADGRDGLRIINVSNPRQPFEVGAIDTPEFAWGVAVDGTYAYVADRLGGLRIIDVSDPAAPSEVGSVVTPDEATDVALDGSKVFVTAFEGGGLRVYDVSSPTNPSEMGWIDTPGSAYALVLDGGYAYLADGGGGLRIVRVADPASLGEAGFYSAPGWARDVCLDGGLVYIANETLGLRVIDVADPSSPQEIGSYDTPGRARGVTVKDGLIYLADLEGGLRILRQDR